MQAQSVQHLQVSLRSRFSLAFFCKMSTFSLSIGNGWGGRWPRSWASDWAPGAAAATNFPGDHESPVLAERAHLQGFHHFPAASCSDSAAVGATVRVLLSDRKDVVATQSG